jgi:hypothetical protein
MRLLAELQSICLGTSFSGTQCHSIASDYRFSLNRHGKQKLVATKNTLLITIELQEDKFFNFT